MSSRRLTARRYCTERPAGRSFSECVRHRADMVKCFLFCFFSRESLAFQPLHSERTQQPNGPPITKQTTDASSSESENIIFSCFQRIGKVNHALYLTLAPVCGNPSHCCVVKCLPAPEWIWPRSGRIPGENSFSSQGKWYLWCRANLTNGHCYYCIIISIKRA